MPIDELPEKRLVIIDLPNLVSARAPFDYQENLKRFKWEAVLGELKFGNWLNDDDTIEVCATAMPLIGERSKDKAEKLIKTAIGWKHQTVLLRETGDIDPILMSRIWMFFLLNSAAQMLWSRKEVSRRIKVKYAALYERLNKRRVERGDSRDEAPALYDDQEDEQAPAMVRLGLVLLSGDGGYAQPLANIHWFCGAGGCIELRTLVLSVRDNFSNEFRKEFNQLRGMDFLDEPNCRAMSVEELLTGKLRP